MEILELLRKSTPFAMLIGAIIVTNFYTNHITTPYFVTSMICWFVVLGPVHWIDVYISNVIEAHSDDTESNQLRAWLTMIVAMIVSGFGLYFLARAVLLLIGKI